MQVITIENGRINEFLELSEHIYANSSTWIPPIKYPILSALRSEDCFGSYGEMKLFGLEHEGRLVARLAALVNPRLQDEAGYSLGQIGYFDAKNIGEACTALFDTACDWLAAKSVSTVLGPMNGGAHTPHRLMTHGFETTPFLGEPRNPPYYSTLFELAGFAAAERWDTYMYGPEELTLIDNHVDTYLKAQTFDYSIETPQLNSVEQILLRIHPMLDTVWRGHTGYASFDIPEMAERYGGLFALMTEGDVMFLKNKAGRDIGFFIGYPDYADEVRALNGDATDWGKWLRQPAQQTARWVAHTIGLLPEARGRIGSYALTRFRIRNGIRRGYTTQVGALANERWNLFRRLGIPADRSYHLYRKTLS